MCWPAAPNRSPTAKTRSTPGSKRPTGAATRAYPSMTSADPHQGSTVDDQTPTYDLITMGRSSIDLYSQDIGAPFEEITGFAAYVGGCPTNISVGAQRLGLRTALLTAVGDDQVGNFILHFL